MCDSIEMINLVLFPSLMSRLISTDDTYATLEMNKRVDYENLLFLRLTRRNRVKRYTGKRYCVRLGKYYVESGLDIMERPVRCVAFSNKYC